ncbi:MAG TPA: FAD:protein FMN transferase, partial [Acidimicrobiales bacterium]|nr:FAD:protein FMN transferase [Acidimicrobiales bacterium]
MAEQARGPADGATAPVAIEDGEVVGRTTAMTCPVTVRVRPGDGVAGDRAVAAAGRALALFGEVEADCTRFRPDSPLMRANRNCHRWWPVPALCHGALAEAHRAYLRTRGRFDPRILTDLVDLGYDRTLPFAQG